jgi:hypothetical protein
MPNDVCAVVVLTAETPAMPATAEAFQPVHAWHAVGGGDHTSSTPGEFSGSLVKVAIVGNPKVPGMHVQEDFHEQRSIVDGG